MNFDILTSCLADCRVNILMYHSIADNTKDPWAVSKYDFFSQMKWLKQNKYKVLPLSEAIHNLDQQKKYRKTIVLTFDDGYVDFLENAMPVLKDFEFPSTLFVLPGIVGEFSYWEPLELRKPLLDWKGLREIVQLGCTIGSHGMKHSDLTRLDPEELQYELYSSKKKLQDELDLDIDAFSYPWGRFTDREADAVKGAGYSCALTVGSQWGNYHKTDRFRLERAAMCSRDSIPDFALKVCGHKQLFRKGRALLGELANKTQLFNTCGQ